MKKLLFCLCTMFICTFAIAETININWKVDGTNYAQSSCQTGSNLTLPANNPTKYGYDFVGWSVNTILNGTRKSLFDGQYQIGVYDMGDGHYNPGATNRVCNKNMIPVQPSTQYRVFSNDYDLGNRMRWIFYDSNQQYISYASAITSVITPANAAYINFYIANDLTLATAPDIQIDKEPNPTNPVEYEFFTLGNMTLRALGTGDNKIADTYDTATGKITRRVGVKVFNGTESWGKYPENTWTFLVPLPSNCDTTKNSYVLSTHFKTMNDPLGKLGAFVGNNWVRGLHVGADGYFSDFETFKQWLMQQYDAGTPVTVYYPLETPIEENVN